MNDFDRATLAQLYGSIPTPELIRELAAIARAQRSDYAAQEIGDALDAAALAVEQAIY